jgi:succinate dehydrogenase/fumarate reductase flavoprotein subunit
MADASVPYRGRRWWSDLVAEGIPSRPPGRRSGEATDFDVVVVGGGAAGHMVANFVADVGLTAVMLEAGEAGGGTAYKSAAGMWFPDNSLMRERGLEPDREWAINHMAKLAAPAAYNPAAERLGLDEHLYELIEAYFDNSRAAVDAMIDVGVTFIEFPSITGNFDAMVEYHNETAKGNGTHLTVANPAGRFGAGPHLMDQLAAAAAARGVDLLTEHRVKDVVLEDGAMVGVVADTPDGERTLRAARAVVFASGGYPHSPELMAEHFPVPMYGSCAVATSRGDFIGIAAGLGARLGNMGCGWGTQHPLEMMLEDREVGEHIGCFPGDSVIMVNAAGERVVNEKETYHERSQVHYLRDESGGLPNHLLFIVYDDFVAGQPTDQPNLWPAPQPDKPWVISAPSLEGLAEQIDARLASYGDRIGGVRLKDGFAAQLGDTIERFNGFARDGVDADFHRGEGDFDLDWTGPSHADNEKNPTMYPLDDGPYHAIIVAGSVLDTNGGPEATPAGKVLDGKGEPIPGLYGVGNCVASAAGEGYWSGGSTLGPALVYSYLAAAEIVKEPRRRIAAAASTAN